MNHSKSGFAFWSMLMFFCLLTPSLLWSQTATNKVHPFDYSVQKRSTGSSGAVVSAHPLASLAGLEILKKGGNAIDAAITVQLALAVVYPGAGNLGGGGFLVASLQNGKKLAIDYRETAPAAAFRDMYLDSSGNAQPTRSQDGHLAAGVPGTVAGLFASHKYGRFSFRILIEPAILLAEKGFVITEAEAASLNYMRNHFIKQNTVVPVFVKAIPWKSGDTLIQTDLANTLKRIRDRGANGFYDGETARLIVEEMKRGQGIITATDLRSYKAKERRVLEFAYKGYTIVSMPLPSSGGIILQQMLGMIEPKDISTMGFHSAAAVQLMTEVERRAFADRAEFLGDPDFVKVPVEYLVSKKYLQERMKDFQPGVSNNSSTITAGSVKPESEETTHLSVADRWGNAVAVTTTLNGGYGSATVVGGAGFLLNNEMDDFSIKPGVPNMYGALGNEKNAIAPGKRMLSSMTPTIVLNNGVPCLIAGTPGGTTIPTSVFQTIVNVIDFKLSLSDAINKPKFHHQWLPDTIYTELDFPAETSRKLTDMGYKVETRGEIGRTELILVSRTAKNKYSFEAVGDKRGDDDARAF